jgi:glycosyltransferase involved in cell wall biosynthesis
MPSVKLLHVTPAFYPATYYGGPIFSTYALANALALRSDVTLRVLTSDAAGPIARVPVKSKPMVYPGGYEVFFAKRIGNGSFSLELLIKLWSMMKWADVVHLTGVYSPTTFPTLLLARLLGKAVVWSPRGSLLATQNWRDSPRRKLKWIWERVCILLSPKHTILHVTSEPERIASLARLPNTSAVVIPNGAEVPDECTDRLWVPGGELRLAFVGRLHPVKAIDNLIKALKIEGRASLDIYGEGDGLYTDELRASATELGTRVRFHGHVDGAAKTRAFSNADVCVLPSHSENFGMVVAEALAHGVPVIVSKNAPWPALETNDCGLWVDNSPKSLAEAIQILRERDLAEMGARGREYIVQNFGWPKQSDEFVAVLKSAMTSDLPTLNAADPATQKFDRR